MIDLSTKLKEGTIGDLSRAITVVNRLKDVDSVIMFPRLKKDFVGCKILALSDASLGSINNGTGSTGAHIIWLIDGTGK